jgi:GntR family transcriptional regulator
MALAEPLPRQRPFSDRHVDVVRRLRDLIRAGITGGGVRRPLVEAQLQRQYGTSRGVVRGALDLLREEGLIERVPGAGTFAASGLARHRFDRLQGLSEGVDRGIERVDHQVLALDHPPAPAVVAEALGIAVGEPAVMLERRSFIDGRPVMLGTHWLPLAPFAELDATTFERELHEVYESCLDQRVAGSHSTIEAVSADAGVAELLDVVPGAALLRFERHITMVDGRAVELGFVRCRGDRLSLDLFLERTPTPVPAFGSRSPGADRLSLWAGGDGSCGVD